MPRKTTSIETPISKSDASAQVVAAVVSSSEDDLKNLFESADENIQEAYSKFGDKINELTDSKLAFGQRILQIGHRNKWGGNLMAASTAYTHGKNVKEVSQLGYKGGAWVVGKIGDLFG